MKIIIAAQMGAFRNKIIFEDFTLNGEKIAFATENPYNKDDIRLIDVLAALKACINAEYLYAMDVNYNGKLEILDVLKLIKIKELRL